MQETQFSGTNNSFTRHFDHQLFNRKPSGNNSAGEPHFLDMPRRPAFADRPLPKLDLCNPIEAAEELFRELGLDRFLERRGREAEARVDRAKAFVEKAPEADTSDEITPANTPLARRHLAAAGLRHEAGRGEALPLGRARPQGTLADKQEGTANLAPESEMATDVTDDVADYVIDVPWFADEAGREEETFAGVQADDETAFADELGDHDADDQGDETSEEDGSDEAYGAPYLNNPDHVWTSEDIMMMILRDEARASAIAARKQAEAVEAYAAAEAAHYAEAA